MGDITGRKTEHLRICLGEQVESTADGGFDQWQLAYRALPEIALADVDLRTTVAGKELAAPLIIGAMTGGTAEAAHINQTLAQAAESRGVGLALGSGRIALERSSTVTTFDVRSVAPTCLLFANLGAVQLNLGIGSSEANRLVEMLGADALFLHLNPLQEAIQQGGDTDFGGLHARMAEIIPQIDCPVFVKEVGAGIGPETAELLAQLPIEGVGTAGVGGTSWARVEALRATDTFTRSAGMALDGFGVPTVDSLRACRQAMPDKTIVASGGLRSAVDMAKALAFGADAVACALPFLKAAHHGPSSVMEYIDHIVHTLRIICFVCGASTPGELEGRIRRVDG